MPLYCLHKLDDQAPGFGSNAYNFRIILDVYLIAILKSRPHGNFAPPILSVYLNCQLLWELSSPSVKSISSFSLLGTSSLSHHPLSFYLFPFFILPRIWYSLGFRAWNILHSILFYLFICLFCLFAISWAAPAAHGGSQARGWIGAVAPGLCLSHTNSGSEPHLQPTAQLAAKPDP